ncbi:MAG: hypothetical protein Q9160_001633 [Pyrenula sp. 1 TL-2023]
MASILSLAWGILLASTAVEGQTVLQEHIWQTVSYTLYGDRTPLILPETNTLTPLGAQQLYQAGSSFRQRYIDATSNFSSSTNTIIGLSRYQLNVDDIAIISAFDPYSSASAQAFMQGLFPPLTNATNYTFTNGESQLANGSNIEYPLNGYQYAPILTVPPYEESSIWIAGHLNCPMWLSAQSDYYNTAEYKNLLNTEQDFYKRLQPEILDGVFLNASVGYFDAYIIYDYLAYSAIHNSTVNETLDESTLTHARNLASNWVQATSGNSTRSGLHGGDHISTIAGRTLATQILSALTSNIESSGQFRKMILMFGSHEPMVSFLSLAGLLSPGTSQFYGLPQPGSTMTFELFSFASSDSSIFDANNGNSSTSRFPSSDDLHIRFLFQNGTDADPIPYPLFSHSPSLGTVPLSEFMLSLQDFMIDSAQDWCTTCASDADFCISSGSGSSGSGGYSSGRRASHRDAVSPAVAGVIGALVALAVAGLLFGLMMLLFGVRVYRVQRKRRSQLNGFKGGEKLASDQDLSIAKNGAPVPVGASVVKPATTAEVAGAAGAAPRGHERVGSWELKSQENAKEMAIPGMPIPPSQAKRPSFEDDDAGGPFGGPVKVDERV